MQRRSFLINTGAIMAGLWTIPGKSWASDADLIAPTSEKSNLPTATSFLQIPRKLGLSIAISKTLNKIETIDAISALSDLKLIEILKPEISETKADYIFTKQMIRDIVDNDRYGFVKSENLESENSAPVFVEGSLGASGETVKLAVKRLLPKLQSLQAQKFLQTIATATTNINANINANSNTPQLNAKASLTLGDQTWGYGKSIDRQPIQKGDRLRYQIQNSELQPLYWLIWQTGPEELIILPPLNSPQSFITRKSTQPAMSGTAKPDWTASRTGVTDSFLILSKTPFTQTSEQLTQTQVDTDRFLHPVTDPIAIVNCILNDLQRSEPIEGLDFTTQYILDMTQALAFRFTYEVVTKSSTPS